jgi:serine/threonine-protein kinase
VIHCDIKPENIHLDRMGKVRLMDFGIASSTGAASKEGRTAGTPFYMAPEQVLGVDVTIQADIYSFGVVLYELFTGKKPFQGSKVEDIFEKILHQQVDLHPLVAANVPKSIIDAIMKCTSKKLMERPATLGPVVDALTTAAAVEPAAPPKPEPAEPGKLSPSALRAPSEVRLAMPPPPQPQPREPQAKSATAKPAPAKSLLWTVAGAIAVALVLYGVVNFATR